MENGRKIMAMNRLYVVALSMLLFASGCQQEEISAPGSDASVQVVYASTEDMPDTRTYMSGTEIYWSSGDRIAVFFKNTLRKRYDVTPESVSSKNATFLQDSDYIMEGSNVSISNNVAYYPFCDVICAVEGTSYVLSNITLPSTQNYVLESAGLGTYPMVAVTESAGELNFAFKNVCGALMFQLKGSGFIRLVSVKGNSNEVLAGSAVVTASCNQNPSISMSDDGDKVVTLDCGEQGVELDEETPTSFIIALPPVPFASGFTITVTDIWGGIKEYSTSKPNAIQRSTIRRMPAQEYIGVRPPQEGDYIDEYGVNHGQGVEIDGVIWAPVNCGYKAATADSKGFPYGKLYQWGRKYGQGYSLEYDEAEPAIMKGPVSLDKGQSLDNEGVFYNFGSHYTYDWATPMDDKYWNSKTEEDPERTKYDPCPDGWRVPMISELSSLRQNRSSVTTNSIGVKGCWFSGSKVYSASVPRVFLPLAGYRNGNNGDISERGFYGDYWSSTVSRKDGPYSYCAQHLHFRSGYDSMSNSGRAYGHSVRCVRTDKQNELPAEQQIVNLSEKGTANSYIISEIGSYKFTPTKGNSAEPLEDIASAEVLWESFGTDVTPNAGDLVKNVKYANGDISFETPSSFRKGNAVIAAKDASGKVLWSWHIWLTDQPEGQVYYNDAGTMMDRNLGATSATPGDVGALGLLYQWGRKDPFLGSSSISKCVEAKSTITWPSPVVSDSNKGTIGYAIANPTIFITCNDKNYDWQYADTRTIDITRWTEGNLAKSIYDPCPAGWRVPDGGENDVWAKSYGSYDSFGYLSEDSVNHGVNFTGMFGDASIIWYPASGERSYTDGSLSVAGIGARHWTATTYKHYASHLFYGSFGLVMPLYTSYCSGCFSVRCVHE